MSGFTGNGDGDDRACLALFHERIERLQEHGLEAGNGVRNFGLHRQIASQMHIFIVKVERAFESGLCTWNVKCQMGRRGNAVADLRRALQRREGVGCSSLRRGVAGRVGFLFLRALAEIRETLLRCLIGRAFGRDIENPLDV